MKLNFSKAQLKRQRAAGFSGITVGTLVAGTAVGIGGGIAAGIASTAALVSLGVTAANLAGAFSPSQQKVNKAQIDAQISADQTALSQTQSAVDSVASSTSNAKVISYVSLGIAVIGLTAGGILLLRKTKK